MSRTDHRTAYGTITTAKQLYDQIGERLRVNRPRSLGRLIEPVARVVALF